MFEYYIYQHSIPNSDTPFYIGKGKGRNYFRSKSKKNRNTHWVNIVNKYGYEVKITHNNLCCEEANSIEKYLIGFYGRKDLNKGVLCNLTDGGDGSFNYRHTQETKIKIGDYFRGKFCGEKNPMYGKKISEEHRKKLGESAKISNKRRVNTDETKNKISSSLKLYFNENPEKKTLIYTEERNKKISEKLKGRVFTQEWKDKIRESKRINKYEF